MPECCRDLAASQLLDHAEVSASFLLWTPCRAPACSCGGLRLDALGNPQILAGHGQAFGCVHGPDGRWKKHLGNPSGSNGCANCPNFASHLAYPREPMCREGRDEMVQPRVPTVPMPKEAAGHWWHPGKLTSTAVASSVPARQPARQAPPSAPARPSAPAARPFSAAARAGTP